jgi:hypothetical protein
MIYSNTKRATFERQHNYIIFDRKRFSLGRRWRRLEESSPGAPKQATDAQPIGDNGKENGLLAARAFSLPRPNASPVAFALGI